MYDGIDAEDIRWNFEKFLLDPHGRPMIRYASPVDPTDISSDIEQLLAEFGLIA